MCNNMMYYIHSINGCYQLFSNVSVVLSIAVVVSTMVVQAEALISSQPLANTQPASNAVATRESIEDEPKQQTSIKLLGGRGTLKRKRHLQKLIEEHEKRRNVDDYMDMFSSNPDACVPSIGVNIFVKRLFL